MSRRVLAVGGGMGMGIVNYGRKYGMDGAVVEINADLRKRQCDTYKIPGYNTVQEAIAAHKDIVGVYIATPNHTHADIAIALAPLNIPVFMEKPLGIDEAQCRAVVDAYSKSKGWLQIDFEYRFSPLYAVANDILKSGELGDLRSINIEYTVGNYRPSYGWRLDPVKAGGMFCEKLCHFMDLIRFWSGSEFKKIQITAAPKSMGYYDNASTDNIVGQFVMESGAFVSLLHTHGSTALPLDAKTQNNSWADHGHRLGVYLNTTEGCINIDIWRQIISVIKRDAEDDMAPRLIRRIDYSHMDFMASHHDMSGVLKDFVRRVHEGSGPRLPLADSFKTMLAVFEADRQLHASCLEANARFAK